MRGFFITLEGPEGAGKSTQVRLLDEELRARGFTTHLTAEPGGDPVAMECRQILLHTTEPISDRTELLLYLAARAQHVEMIIRPALAEGKVVISDRFADSTMAYQGYARGLDLKMVKALNAFATGGLVPDQTLLLDLPPDIGMARQEQRNRFEEESIEFHQKVRAGFLELAAQEPERIKVIDASGTVAEVQARILDVVLAVLTVRR